MHLRAGEWVRITDAKGRRHNVRLEAGKEFSTKKGQLKHDDMIGQPEGTVLRIAVAGGGCSGFQYEYKIVQEQPTDDDLVLTKDSATVPYCRSRSTRATRRRRSCATSHATLVATMVAPTPPRVPVTATSLPSLWLLLTMPLCSLAARIAFCNRGGVTGLTR